MKIRLLILTFFALGNLYSDSFTYKSISFIQLDAIASSILTEPGKPATTYAPFKVFDSNFKSAWCSDNKKETENPFIEVKIKPSPANGIMILNGIANSVTIYKKNNRIKDYELFVYDENGDEQKISGKLKDNSCGSSIGRDTPETYCQEYTDFKNDAKKVKDCIKTYREECVIDSHQEGGGGEKIQFKKPICLTKFKLVIKSVYPGKEFNDTCISELFPIVTDTIYGLYEVRDPTLNEIFKNCPIP